MSTIIEDVVARKILNSRGEAAIEVEVATIDGFGIASAPSGASKGKAEAAAYPPGGVDEAIKKVEELIAPELIGLNADNQEEIDNLLRELDGTEKFTNIGGNTAYAVSLAVADAAASSYNMPLFQYLGGCLACYLPYPLGNVLGGGKHALGKVPDIQEFLVLPAGAPTFMAAAEGADWKHSAGFYVVLVDQPGKKSWPITGASFIILYKEQDDAVHAETLLNFFDWCYKHGDEIAIGLDYVPIPDSVVEIIKSAWIKEIKSNGKQVWH